MLRPKNKFYELSQREKEGEKINDIYKLISQQEENMAQLLSKYQDKGDREASYEQHSRTIATSSLFETSPVIKNGRYVPKIDHTMIELPPISPNRKSNIKRPQKKPQSNQIPSDFELKSQKDRSRLKSHLQKAYGTDKLKSNRSKSKIEPVQNQLQIKKFLSERFSKEKREQSQNYSKQSENDLPTPLGYLKYDVDEQSSSEEGDVPLTYYEREFRTSIRQQCLQQTNFLYFSKNESIKDWTEGLLLLFQKHDKQLQSLRRKCRYLQKFDDNFFTIDIFKDS